jgi:uncharacterized protein YndB with AHSA1/START domain
MGMTIGVLHVRRSVLIEAPPERVWEEFGSFDRVDAWLGLGHRLHTFEPWIDGQVEMSVDIDRKTRRFGGPILVYDPDRELSFENNWQAPFDWPVPTFWTLRLTPVYDGTLVELFHHGFERLGADAADQLENYETGWDVKHLHALRSIVGR